MIVIFFVYDSMNGIDLIDCIACSTRLVFNDLVCKCSVVLSQSNRYTTGIVDIGIELMNRITCTFHFDP